MRTEAHITIVLAPEREGEVLGWVRGRGFALTHIELARGRHPSQLMITSRTSTDDPIASARKIAADAAAQPGVAVMRTKVEAELDSGDGGLYLEHHVKVRADHGFLPALTALATSHDAHLSRNPLRVLPEGVEERYLTQRFQPGAGDVATLALARLTESLRDAGVAILKVERERVLYDDRLQLDDGWLTAE